MQLHCLLWFVSLALILIYPNVNYFVTFLFFAFHTVFFGVCVHAFIGRMQLIELPPGQYNSGRWQHLFSSHLLFSHARCVKGQEEVQKSDTHDKTCQQ